MNLNYPKDDSKNSSLKLLQKHVYMIDTTLEKQTGVDDDTDLKEDATPFQAKHFSIKKNDKPMQHKIINSVRQM